MVENGLHPITVSLNRTVIVKLSQTNASIVIDDVFERIGQSNSTHIYELLEIQSYNTTECQNYTTSCSGTDEDFHMYAKVGFSGS